MTTFALVLYVAGALGAPDSYVLDSGLTAEDCLQARTVAERQSVGSLDAGRSLFTCEAQARR